MLYCDAEAAAKKDAGKKLPAAKRQLLQKREERETLTEDYALLRKLKKGKLSDREFDISIGFLLADDPTAAPANAAGNAESPASTDNEDSDDGNAAADRNSSGKRARSVGGVKGGVENSNSGKHSKLASGKQGGSSSKKTGNGESNCMPVSQGTAAPGQGLSRTARKRRGRIAKAVGLT